MRNALRELVARRLSRELANLLLPIDPAEAALDDGSTVVLPGSMPWGELAASYPELLAPLQRKQRGAWFTSLELALPTARRTLSPLLAATPQRTLRIIDPAVGGGTFLLAALHELRAHGLPTSDAVRCLHGIDIDGTAAALAALAVWAAAELPVDALPCLAGQMHVGDGLLAPAAGTFDAVLTNPPWETLQSHHDAEAHVARLRPHFQHQGAGKLYTYRLFVERAHQLLGPGGRFGLIVPASLWFDRDALPLRDLLLDHCTWEWLFGFENTQKLFPIDSRYRFAAVLGQKGGTTAAVKVAFGRRTIAEWAAEAPHHTLYERAQIAELSPLSRTFVEVEHASDLQLLHKMQAHSVPLVGPTGVFRWRQGDFNMTGDRSLFVLRSEAERDGWRRSSDGCWHRPGDDTALLPLYQGAMVYDLHPNAAAHAGGTGHGTLWETPSSLDELRPAYLLRETTWSARKSPRVGASLVLRALSNATNERTAIACLLPEVPCGNSLGVMLPRAATATPLRTMAAGAAVLGSLAFDWALRLRLTGTNLNAFVLGECRLPRCDDAVELELARCALRLCAVLPWHGGLWTIAQNEGWAPSEGPAMTTAARAELLTAVDVRVGTACGFTAEDVQWIVRGCDQPAAALRRKPPVACHAKGFWRVDRLLSPAERRPNRWLAAVSR